MHFEWIGFSCDFSSFLVVSLELSSKPHKVGLRGALGGVSAIAIDPGVLRLITGTNF